MPKKRKTTNPKFWNVLKDENENEGIIELYGEVVTSTPTNWFGDETDEQFVTPAGFDSDLKAVQDCDNITIKFNSIGGDLYTGIAIFNALNGLKGKKIGIVEGIAASAITAPLMACDVIKVHPSSEIMIHGVRAVLESGDYYTSDDLEKLKDSIDASDRALANIYSGRTGKTVDECLELMRAETWMVGNEAVNMGFADEVIEGNAESVQETAEHVVTMVAGITYDLYKNKLHTGAEPAVNITAEKAENKEAEKPMELKDLREKYPELVNEIEKATATKAVEEARDGIIKEAVKAERERLEAIDRIAPECAADLVKEAKYGDGNMTAKDLAFANMLREKEMGEKFKSAEKKDAKESNTEMVAAAPSNEDESEDAKEKKELARVSKLYKSVKGGRN